jgi:phosphoribosylanthranilate isomerase
MRKTIIQIYEIQKPGEAAAVVALGVDHVGSVLLSADKWKVPTIRKTVQTVQRLGAKSGLIPLFGDPTKLFYALDYYQPDFVHFCEALAMSPGSAAKVVQEFDSLLSFQIDIKDRFPQLEIMRSLSIPRPGNAGGKDILPNIINVAGLLAPFCDYFLLDTLLGSPSDPLVQPVSGYVGITGEVCDWSLAAAIIEWSPIPVIMAGGISSENVFDAIIQLRPAGVDSCTKTNAVDKEGRPVRFKKNLREVKRLVEEVKRADASLADGASAVENCLEEK